MKKKTKKKVVKKSIPKKSQELVIRVMQPDTIPTSQELAEPMRDGKKLTIPKTWVSEAQLIKILQKTPTQHVFTRPGKGGQSFKYVTGSYVIKALNYIFGWNWDFETIAHGVQQDQIWVQGKLTVKGTHGETIVKTQFGRADIKFKKDTKIMLDFGNDLKAATTDALKKCASMLGIASDIYSKAEYKEETGREPKEISQPYKPSDPEAAIRDVQNKYGGETQAMYPCVGADGKGCRYGIPEISEQEKNYSTKIFGKALCRDCQKDGKPKK